AADIALDADTPTLISNFTGNLDTVLGGISTILGGVVAGAVGIDAGVILRAAEAEVRLDDVSIGADGAVDVLSEGEAEADADALISERGKVGNFQTAVGYARAAGSAQTLLTGATAITAQGSVHIASDARTAVQTEATASNLEAVLEQEGFSGDGKALSVAIANSELTSRAVVGDAVSITSALGNIDVSADGDASTTSDALAVGYVQGLAGATVAVSYDESTVEAVVDGDLTAAGAAVGAGEGGFDPAAAVNAATDVITLTDHGFAMGEEVIYRAGALDEADDAAAIGGLQDGATYYAIVLDENSLQLAEAPVLDLSLGAADPDAAHALITTDTAAFSLGAVDPDEDFIRLVGSGLQDGDQVRYRVESGPAIAGLIDGAMYEVAEADDEGFELRDRATGDVVEVAQGAALGTHVFEGPDGDATLVLAAVDAFDDAVILRGHGLTDGQTVVYDLAGDPDGAIGGLLPDGEYAAEVLDADRFRLLRVDPVTGAVGARVVLDAPLIAGVHTLTFEADRDTFVVGDALDADRNEIRIIGHGFQDGDVVGYATDPTRGKTVQVATIDNTDPHAPVAGTQTAQAPDPALGGLDAGSTYVVMRVDADTIRLVDRADALARALPLDLTGPGQGDAHLLSGRMTTEGVGVHARLAAVNTVDSAAQQRELTRSQLVLNQTDLLEANTQRTLFESGKLYPTDVKALNSDLATGDQDLALAGGIGVNVADHTVRASVGEGGAAALTSGRDIETTAKIDERYATSVEARETSNQSEGGKIVALAVGVSVVDNTAEAIVGANAVLDADRDATIEAEVIYPLLLDDALTALKDGVSNISGDLEQLDPFLALTASEDPILNTLVRSKTTGLNSGSTTISGSVAVNSLENRAEAALRGGASLTAGRDADVTAATDMELFTVAGDLNTRGKKGSTNSDALPAGESDGRSLGGAVLIDVLENTTLALIGDGAVVDATGDLAVTADEIIVHVALSAAGGTAGTESEFAFAGSGLGAVHLSTTHAGIETGPAGVSITSASLTIRATSDMLHVGVAGAISKRTGGDAVGVGAAVHTIERDTQAFLGQAPEATGPRGASTITTGDLSVEAVNTGQAWVFAVAGTVATS
ncbi:MAG: hypothetical protein AAFU61_07005, partial [Pseudomonadota bacterium]